MLFLTFLLLYSIIIENERTTNLRIISTLRGREEDHERAGHESAERDDLHHQQGMTLNLSGSILPTKFESGSGYGTCCI